MNWSTDEAS